jgi:predicted CopG family antitoxin
MGSKNISIPEEVYEKLREERGEDESFGDAIDRLLGRRSLAEFWGGWSEETAAEAREAVAIGRERSDDRLRRLYDR